MSTISDVVRRRSAEARVEDAPSALERIKNLKRKATLAVQELYRSVLDVDNYATTGDADLFKKRLVIVLSKLAL